MTFLRKLIFKNRKANLKLEKGYNGQWMVSKKFHILYIGNKEKFELFIKNQLSQGKWNSASA